jgi:hypothetical protein
VAFSKLASMLAYTCFVSFFVGRCFFAGVHFGCLSWLFFGRPRPFLVTFIDAANDGDKSVGVALSRLMIRVGPMLVEAIACTRTA